MKTRRHFHRAFLIALMLTLGSGGYAVAACTPSTYAYCWEQRELCLMNAGEEEDCNAEYFACLARRGCG